MLENNTYWPNNNSEYQLSVTDDFCELKSISDMDDGEKTYKIFSDPIHGHMEMHPLCIAIIDTPEFQRLRYIKQDGIANYVYPGATHTRFEHCIGVCHIAGKFVMKLKERQPELNIDDNDVLSVKIAGLCHDLGHGPYSHSWEQFLRFTGTVWTHEKCSIDVFEYLIEHNGLLSKFQSYLGKNYQEYINYIKQQILGDETSIKDNHWITPGAPEQNKDFLYEIVSNKISGVDVDKWDYLPRDCHYLGLKQSFDAEHLLNFIRVCQAEDGCQHVCFRDKTWLNVIHMFQTRWMLHRVAYKHRVVRIIEIMLMQVLCAADKHLRISGSDGKKRSLSESSADISAFVKLSDDLFRTILLSDDVNLLESRQILERIEKRDLYGFVGQVGVDETWKRNFQGKKLQYVQEIFECIDVGDQISLTIEDVILDIHQFDYGMNKDNPLDFVYFYTKDQPFIAKRQEIRHHSKMTAKEFVEMFLICICRRKEFIPCVTLGFEKWCLKNNLKLILDEKTGMFGQVSE